MHLNIFAQMVNGSVVRWVTWRLVYRLQTCLAPTGAVLPPLTKLYLKSFLGRNIGNETPLNPQAQWCNYIINQIN